MSVKQLRILVPALAVLVLALGCASGASADGTVTWGISGVTPSLDTANGNDSSAATPGVIPDSNVCPNGIGCSPEINPESGTNPILPGPFRGENTADAPHSAEDLGVWNPESQAPTSGQVLEIAVTGCAIEDTSSTSQSSQGIPVNTVLFQTLTPDGVNWTVDNTAGSAGSNGTYPFQIPFCQSATNPGGVAPSTVTTFQPLHLCISAGDVVAFHDLGGFVEAGSHYPEGIPMEVLAPASGVATDSFVGVNANPIGPGIYGPGDTTDESGYATEADQEVTMQIIEGSGNDAYGLCPGGFGDETSTSNAIDCDFTTSADGTGAANPVQYPDHPFCAEPGEPIPGSNVPPSGNSSTPTPLTTAGVSGKGDRSAATTKLTAPVLTQLKMNPPLYVAKRGAVVTYIDSHPGITTLRIYRVTGKHQALARTIRHQDKVKVGFHVYGLKPGSYRVTATAVYKDLVSRTVTATFKIIAKR
jgi:hypothetical protein